MPSLLEQYRISDFLDWHRTERLVLNPDFQRGSVWTPAARTYLIDTILRQLPIPKVYLRTWLDVNTKQSIREVVDGQQRLRAIVDFAEDKFALSRRAAEFKGLRYSTMDSDLQERFLGYAIAVDQLLNASDNDVLEVFARLNSYSLPLNPPEKRHARFQGDFKWTIRNASRRWAVLWEKYKILTVRERVRMMDDSLTAEMFGVLLEGVTDGGQPKIDALYKRHDNTFDPDGDTPRIFDDTVKFFVDNIADDLLGTAVLRPPHFLMLFAALAHARHGLPSGEMGGEMPTRDDRLLTELAVAKDNLRTLAATIESADSPSERLLTSFWRASLASTQRITSRRVRFPVYVRALLPVPLVGA